MNYNNLVKHNYSLSGFIKNRYQDSSFNYTNFRSRKDAEEMMYSMITRFKLNVERNEFADKHTNEIVCDHARFTISRN